MDALEQFLRYSLIGVANTIIHAFVMAFAIKRMKSAIAIANSVAFVPAVTFSYFANATWTFSVSPSWPTYLLFVIFMGALAYGMGKAGDKHGMHPVVIFVAFTSLSLAVGFIYSKLVVFGV